MRYCRLDSPRHSYVPASFNWTLVIFMETPVNSNLPPELTFISALTRYHPTFSPTLTEDITISILPWSEVCCLFSSASTPPLSEKNVVNQICYWPNIKKERTTLRVDQPDIIKNLSFFSTDQIIIVQVKGLPAVLNFLFSCAKTLVLSSWMVA